MFCIACSAPARTLCTNCVRRLAPAPSERLLAGGVTVRAPFAHEGTAQVLVHRLKYRGIVGAGRFLAEAMAPLVTADAVLVPVPRNPVRLLRYGVDSAQELVRHIVDLTGARASPVLRSSLWTAPRAGRSRSDRRPPRFRVGDAGFSGRCLLVDDVLTTGGTVLAAAAALSSSHLSVLTATIRGD